jgi:hypothetical protein
MSAHAQPCKQTAAWEGERIFHWAPCLVNQQLTLVKTYMVKNVTSGDLCRERMVAAE